VTSAWVRPTSRVLVLDPDQRLLLGPRGDAPEAGAPTRCWYAPGGGVESGEDLRTAAVRELAEETGLVAGTSGGGPIGPPTPRRRISCSGTSCTRSTAVGRTALELAADEPHRWWGPAEIARAV
jgi:8-oxo-dGTP pyrophosphatase MutT (NUDIX family)